jgi:hypothetical protein
MPALTDDRITPSRRGSEAQERRPDFPACDRGPQRGSRAGVAGTDAAGRYDHCECRSMLAIS